MKQSLVTSIILLGLSCSCFARKITPSTIIGLIDTTYRTEYSYQTLIKLSEATGLTIRFIHPSTNIDRELCGCDGIFLALDNEFLTNTTSAYAKLVIEPLSNFLQQNKCLFGIMLPERSIIKNQTDTITKFIEHDIGLSYPNLQKTVSHFIKRQQTFQPLYTTHSQIASDQKHKKPSFTDATELPQKNFPSYLDNNFPLGLLLQNKHTKLFITTLSTMTFADLAEDETKNPIDPSKRRELLKANLAMLRELSKLLYEEKNQRAPQPKYNVIKHLVNKTRHRHNCKMYKKQKGIYQWTSDGIACGWMNIDYDKKLMPKNLSYIAQTNFDMLWLELPIGLYKKPAEFDKKVSFFTEQLQKAYKEHNRPIPKIFLDFDFGATLQWCTESTHPVDIYGTTYNKIPSPLDYKKFWNPCILEVLKNICARWESTIGNNLPIDGILFNFYFWNAKKTMPFYNNLVDFSDSAWNAYKKYYNRDDIPSSPKAQERIDYIIKNDKLNEYFIALERETYHLAHNIIDDIRSIMPCAMIAAYTHTPEDTWFYRGMMRGLSTKHNPLLWLTSNLNYYDHQHWIKYNNINALHITNVHLDHFNDKHDIRMINSLAGKHDGVWYSRVSRIGKKYKANKWWSAEATTLEPKKVIKLINKQSRK